MSITHLKKQAKKLVRLLPAHITANPAGSSLAACQELIARASGFPSFHAATTNAAAGSADSQRLSTLILEDWQDVLLQNIADPNDLWPLRTEVLVKAVFELQIYLEARGKTLDSKTIYELSTLENAYTTERTLRGVGFQGLVGYLQMLPAYVFPKDRKNNSIDDLSLMHHDFLVMRIKSVREADETKKKDFEKKSPESSQKHSKEESAANYSIKMHPQFLFEELQVVSTMIQEAKKESPSEDNSPWLWRTHHLVSILLNLEVYLQSMGETLGMNCYSIDELEKCHEKWHSDHPAALRPLGQMLKDIPMYKTPQERGSEEINHGARIQFGYVTMTVTRKRTEAFSRI